jgi:predicted RNA-binding protein with EMAP domain
MTVEQNFAISVKVITTFLERITQVMVRRGKIEEEIIAIERCWGQITQAANCGRPSADSVVLWRHPIVMISH